MSTRSSRPTDPLAACPTAHLAIDAAGLLRAWNAAAESLLGWQSEEVLGRPLEQLLCGSDGGPVPGLGRQARHRDGHPIDVRTTSWLDDGTRHVLVHLASADSARDRALVADEERLRLLADGTRDYGIFMLDPGGIIVTWTPGAQLLTGYDESEVVGRHFSLFYTREQRFSGHPTHELERAVATGRYEEEAWRVRKDGSLFWASVVITALRSETGELRGFGKVTRDITERQRTDLALRASEQRFRRVFHDAPIGVSLLDLEGRFLQVNPSLAALTGFTVEQLLTMGLDDLTLPEEVAADRGALASVVEGRTESFSRDKRFLSADGSTLWVNVHVVPLTEPDGTVSSLLGHTQDISAQHRYEQHLLSLAHHDPLTGLANRSLFQQELQSHLQRCRRYGPSGAVLVLDLDHFKRVNDALGHSAGDELIIALGQVLKRRLRAADVVARLGGDEFAVLLPMASREKAERVAAAVLEAVRTEMGAVGSHSRTMTASIGVAVIDASLLNAVDLLAAADLAMFDAKHAGRDRFRLAPSHKPGPGAALPSDSTPWATRLETALATDRFELWAQPLVDLRTGGTHTHELLLRLRTPAGEALLPRSFLAIADRLGMTTDIDQWVVNKAVDLLALLQRTRPHQRLEINLSELSLGDQRLRDLVAGRIADSEVDPSGLVFAIEERAAARHPSQSLDLREHLRGLGCRVALDGFGAGPGSYAGLKRLKIDYVKLAVEVVEGCATSHVDRLVLESALSVCHELGVRTVAQGVTDAACLAYLRGTSVEQVQGFHLGRPVPLPEAFPELPRWVPTGAAA